MNELIERAKKLDGHVDVLITHSYLINEYSEKTIDEIKAARQDKTEQLPPAAQQELSIRGTRTAFLEFHRFMYSLSDADMIGLKAALKKFYTENKLGEDTNTYTDFNILEDVTDFQLCLRENNIPVCTEIAQSYRRNQKLTEDFPEITSQHLIDFAKKLLESE